VGRPAGADVPSARSLARVLSPEAKESLKHLEVFARRKVDGFLHGIHRSRRIGVSTEFDHHADYHPGDPLKHVDWRASARHDRYYVKRYVMDTALTVRLVVDRSASMLPVESRIAAGPGKYLQACRLAACLAYLVVKERDAAGLTLTTARETIWLPASSRDDRFVALLTALVSSDAVDEDNLGACLRTILDRGERKGMIAVVSDLMFAPQPVQRQLASLVAQGHEVLVFQLREPVEEDFPFSRWVQFHDLERPSVKHRVDTVPLKRIYREEYQALVEDWRRWANTHGVHFVTFRTDGHVETVLSEYIAFRNRTARRLV